MFHIGITQVNFGVHVMWVGLVTIWLRLHQHVLFKYWSFIWLKSPQIKSPDLGNFWMTLSTHDVIC